MTHVGDAQPRCRIGSLRVGQTRLAVLFLASALASCGLGFQGRVIPDMGVVDFAEAQTGAKVLTFSIGSEAGGQERCRGATVEWRGTNVIVTPYTGLPLSDRLESGLEQWIPIRERYLDLGAYLHIPVPEDVVGQRIHIWIVSDEQPSFIIDTDRACFRGELPNKRLQRTALRAAAEPLSRSAV